MDRRGFLGLLGAMTLLPCSLSMAAEVAGSRRLGAYRVSRQADATSLILDVFGNVSYKVFSLAHPPRVVIDLDGVVPHMPVEHMDFSGTPISGIRSGRHGDGMRLVLDMRQAVTPQSFMLDGAKVGHRQLVINLPHSPAAAMAASAVAAAPVHTHHARRPAVISIDAGHGGKDPGAVSASDHYEKYVAFGIASKLHDLLDDSVHFQPVMTRSDDTFIALRERVLLAHEHKADMFVSIHADAAPNRSARGASVYVLSEHGASSAMARFLAESENSADRYDSLRDSALYSHDKQLSEVLVDMSMRTTSRYSQDLGNLLLSDLRQASRIHQHHVDHAAFAVLKSPDIPSVLVETGFMSNRDDCGLLLSDKHQQGLAEALCSGITQYFRKYPLAYQAA